jgi:hypothetical protein
MSKRPILGLLLAVMAALLVACAVEEESEAQGETVEMGIDPEVTGNTATTLGTLEDCVRVDVPSPAFDGVSDYNIDVYVQGDTQAPVAYDAYVTYDATKVHIAAPGTTTLIKMPGASPFSDALPDTDGRFTAGAVYLSGGPGTAGDGTLMRLGLDIGGAGVVTFDFDPDSEATAYASPSGDHPVTRIAAQLAINEDCPGGDRGEPTPTPAATAKATGTPKPGVCPQPYRTTPEDFADAALPGPASELPGQRVLGGIPYRDGYLTLELPPGREFVISRYWWDDESTLVVTVYDVETESGIEIRGDGCERGRFLRDPAADEVFNRIMSGLKVGSAYVCPPPLREVVSPQTEPTGKRLTGGSPEAAEFGLDLPAGREFVLWVGVADPGGGFTGIYDVTTRSTMFLGEEGCEVARRVADPAADSVFDQIAAAVPVPVP